MAQLMIYNAVLRLSLQLSSTSQIGSFSHAALDIMIDLHQPLVMMAIWMLSAEINRPQVPLRVKHTFNVHGKAVVEAGPRSYISGSSTTSYILKSATVRL